MDRFYQRITSAVVLSTDFLAARNTGDAASSPQGNHIEGHCKGSREEVRKTVHRDKSSGKRHVRVLSRILSVLGLVAFS